ncbi:MAG: hypothetical protein KDB23_13125 [Planctomycetales bacterium]|nr:hypothetical protein [Planctomycetales bacterium]
MLIAFLLGNAALFGVFANQGKRLIIADLLIAAYPVIQYAAVLGLLAVVARFTRLPTPERKLRPQLSLQEALSWLSVVAMGLAGTSAMLHSSEVSGVLVSSLIVGVLFNAMFMALMSAPIIATMIMVLGRAQGSALKWSVIFLILQQAIVLTIGLVTPAPIIGLLLYELVVLVTMHATAAATAWPFRGCNVLVNSALKP